MKHTKSLASRAAELAAKTANISEPQVLDAAEALHPHSKKPIHRFKVVPAANANGPAFLVFLDERGERLEPSHEIAALFDRHILTAVGTPAVPLATPTIQPDTNVLTLNPGDVFNETITVTIPRNAGPAKADIYFLADTTASMTSILNAVRVGANNILTALNGLGADLAFGVGNYKDFLSGDPYAFQHQLSPTNVVASVTTAINAWFAIGGGDAPEADLFALDSLAVPPGGSIGWRAASKRIIVWFGDAPSHDPICAAASGGAAITEASASAKLVTEGITVLAISTANPGLDDDPTTGTGYVPVCGPPGGTPGQGTRIATATGGTFVASINAGNIVNTIINLVSSAVGAIQNVKLVPSASIAPFVTAINPAAGYGPLAGDQDHTLTFDVTFTGTVPCTSEEQVFTGTLDVVADGRVIASKKVQITVAACAFVYSVKFICGTQELCGCECTPVQPGVYATEINIHNYSLKEVQLVKRFIPVVLAGAPAGLEPRVAKVRAEDRIVIPAQSATMDDCCRISELLFGGDAPSPMPLTIGLMEITASQEVAVNAVYTTSDLKDGSGVAIRVEQISRR